MAITTEKSLLTVYWGIQINVETYIQIHAVDPLWEKENHLSSFRNRFTNVDYSLYQESGQWSIKDSQVEFDMFNSTSAHSDLQFPAINYHINLQRKPFHSLTYMVSLGFSFFNYLLYCCPISKDLAHFPYQSAHGKIIFIIIVCEY